MIITERVNVTINSSNIKHYKSLGYDNIKVRDNINIKVSELTRYSVVVVDVICDICNKERKITYVRYLQNIKKYNIYSCSRKCANIKRIHTNLEKYGVEYISQCDEHNNKVKDTCLEKYGVEYYQQTKEHKDKYKETCIKKYGVDNPNKNSNIREKIKNTCLEKYGVESYMESSKFKSDSKQTCLEKYGTEYYILTSEFKTKTTKTNLEKYGVEKYNNSEKAKQTSFEKYGFTSYTKTQDFLDKTKMTCLKKYGVDNPNKNKKIKKKSNDTRKINRLLELKKYNIVDIDYDNNIYRFFCDCGKEHIFDIDYNTLKNRRTYGIPLCTICNDYLTKSGDEINIYNFIKENYDGDIILSSRNIIKPYELDIFLPELKLAIEYNGLYWHNEITKDNKYHYNKTELCEAKGIQLYHIYEDDWRDKQNIVKNILLDKLHIKEYKPLNIEYDIKEISDNTLVNTFLTKNHINGHIKSKINIGFFNKGQLIALITFRKINNKYELLQFCNISDFNIIDKLLIFFINKYNPTEIITYLDRSIPQNMIIYNSIGFDYIKKIEPNYYYIINKKRENKNQYRKSMLIKQGFNPLKSEHEIMLDRKIFRIYDSGSLLYRWVKHV